MDSLKSLYDKKQYDLILKLTATSEEESDLFYRIAAFTGLGQFEDALFVIQDHQQVLEKDLATLIPIHIDLLCTMERFDQAYSVLDYYSNLPYQSQVVEEILRDIKNVIASEEKKTKLYTISDDELAKYLSSENKEDVLYAIDLLKKRDIFSFLPDVVKVMTTNQNQILRSLMLILLVDKEVDRDLPFLAFDGPLTVNPKKAARPFTGDTFNTLVKRISKEFDDLTLSQNGIQILSNLALYIYPHTLENEDVDEILLAVKLTAMKYLGMKFDSVEQEAKKVQVSEDKVIYYFKLLKIALEE